MLLTIPQAARELSCSPDTVRRAITSGRLRTVALYDKLDEANNKLAKLRAIVAEQAEDHGLWFVAETAAEAYLQAELRRLHAAIESDT